MIFAGAEKEAHSLLDDDGGRLVLAMYSVLLMLGLVLGAPWWIARMMTSGRYRAGLAGRLGRVPAELRPADVWLHAVSVGEVLAASHLVGELRGVGLTVAVSTTTQAGQELARRRFPECAVFYMPLDFAWLMRRYLRVLQPKLVVTMESELWPNLIHQCMAAGISLAVVNARVSDRSFPRYMALRRVWGPLLREVSLFLAQSEATVERLMAMGVAAERVVLSGNLKYDVRAGAETAMTRRVRGWRDELGVKMVVAGSTLPGEEAILLDEWVDVQKAASPEAVMLVIAPRHTNRFDDVYELIGKQGYVAVRCSTLPEFGAGSLSGNVVLLLDTIGDLASMYSLASVAFVGGSLVPKGGHNPLEPAQFGVPVVMGESWENFREIVATMAVADAIRIVRREELREAFVALLRDGAAMGERGRNVFASQAGATERTMTALMALSGAERRSGLKRPILLPLVPVYRAGLWLKELLMHTPKRLPARVISVGSLSAGGAGKTPVVMMVVDMLRVAGLRVDVLSRGYGRSGEGVERVDVAGSTARFGDEPMLMARRLGVPVWVGADRFAAGSAAEGVDVHVLDDGFQHRQLARDLDIVLLTERDVKDALIPAGDLREPLSALRRADVIVLREDEVDALRSFVPAGKSVWVVRRSLQLGSEIPASLLTFCGIARPDGFVAMLREAGVKVAGTVFFADHHAWVERDVTRLIAAARATGATGFCTTEKDAVKLSPAMRERLEEVGPVVVAELRVELLEGSVMDLLGTPLPPQKV